MHYLSQKRFSKFHLLALCALLFVLLLTATALILTRPSAAQAAPAATKLSIRFTCAQAVNYHSGRICVHTQAHAGLTIKVTYCNGQIALSKGLIGTWHADAKGNLMWGWTARTTCRGKATALVTERFKGQSLSATDTFTVK